MSAIRTRHDKTTLLIIKGDNGHFRTLRAITYKKILNKSNAMLIACLHLLATFGLECRAFACKKNTICKLSKVGGGGGKHPPCPSPSAAYVYAFWEGRVAERLKALTRNPEVLSWSPLPAGHAGVNSLLASLPANWAFGVVNPYTLGEVPSSSPLPAGHVGVNSLLASLPANWVF